MHQLLVKKKARSLGRFFWLIIFPDLVFQKSENM
jgi:hypothetical protein